MPAALLKLDENIPDLVAEILGAAGHDVALARSEGLAGGKDEDLLGAAIAEDRAVISFDLDFSDIRRHDPSRSPGIIVLRLRSQSLPAVRRAVLALADLLCSEPLKGRLWILSDDRLRIWPAESTP
jgi:predicted nuclease of predicted toxin-antitoxin system